MNKTPEQDKGCKASQMAVDWYVRLLREEPAVAIKEAYQAGYQAAKDQLADTGKVMNSSNNSNGWISVHDRLPEENELCIVNTEWRGVVPATYGNESWIFDEGQGWSEKPLSYASHWMPLPEAPKDK